MTIDDDQLTPAESIIPIVQMPPDEQTQPAPPPPQGMSLGDHLEELRTRLILCLLPFLPLFIVGLVFYQDLWTLLLTPFVRACEMLNLPTEAVATFQRPGLIEGFLVSARIACYGAMLITGPWIIWQLWQFVAPGLRTHEQRVTRRIFLSGALLFLAGVAVAFWGAIPLGLEFLYRFNQGFVCTTDLPTMEWYLGFVVMCCVGFGIGFETPLVMMGLAWAGIITPAGILKYWRHATVMMMVLGAIFTPPDPFTQILLASMMLLFYWAGYLLACWVAPAREPADDPQARS